MKSTSDKAWQTMTCDTASVAVVQHRHHHRRHLFPSFKMCDMFVRTCTLHLNKLTGMLLAPVVGIDFEIICIAQIKA